MGCPGQLMGQPMLLAGPGMDPSMMGPYGMGPSLCPCTSQMHSPPPPPPAPLPNCCDLYRGSSAAVPLQQGYGIQPSVGYGSSSAATGGMMGQSGMMLDQGSLFMAQGYPPQPYQSGFGANNQQFPGSSQQIQPVFPTAGYGQAGSYGGQAGAYGGQAGAYGGIGSQAMAYLPPPPSINNIPIQQASQQLQPIPSPQQQQPQQLNENENSNTNLNVNSDMTRQHHLLGRSLLGLPRNQ